MQLDIETSANVPDNTANCRIIHDKLIEYNPMNNEINKF